MLSLAMQASPSGDLAKNRCVCMASQQNIDAKCTLAVALPTGASTFPNTASSTGTGNGVANYSTPTGINVTLKQLHVYDNGMCTDLNAEFVAQLSKAKTALTLFKMYINFCIQNLLCVCVCFLCQRKNHPIFLGCHMLQLLLNSIRLDRVSHRTDPKIRRGCFLCAVSPVARLLEGDEPSKGAPVV